MIGRNSRARSSSQNFTTHFLYAGALSPGLPQSWWYQRCVVAMSSEYSHESTEHVENNR